MHPYAYYPPSAAPDSAEVPEVPLLDMMSQCAAATGVTPPPEEWITEVGWPIWGGVVDETMQSSHLIKAVALSGRAGARTFCWYNLQDGPYFDQFPPEQAFGLLRYDPVGPTNAQPKPAFLALKAISQQLGTMGFSRDRAAELHLTAQGDAALFFRDGNRGATVLWSTSADPGKAIRLPLHKGTWAQLIDTAGTITPLTTNADHSVTVTADVNARIVLETPLTRD